VLDQFIMHAWNAGAYIDGAARGPEAFFDDHGANGDGLQLGMGRFAEIDDAFVFPARRRWERAASPAG
jgi:hypothetical protein